MDRVERQDHEATRDHLKAILGLVGDSRITNAELAAKCHQDVLLRETRLRRALAIAMDGLTSSSKEYRRKIVIDIEEYIE